MQWYDYFVWFIMMSSVMTQFGFRQLENDIVRNLAMGQSKPTNGKDSDGNYDLDGLGVLNCDSFT